MVEDSKRLDLLLHQSMDIYIYIYIYIYTYIHIYTYMQIYLKPPSLPINPKAKGIEP